MRITKKEYEELLKALEAARMTNASFGTQLETDRIKETTRLYRATWIISPITQVLCAIEEREGNKR
jgi:hypothetical protein